MSGAAGRRAGAVVSLAVLTALMAGSAAAAPDEVLLRISAQGTTQAEPDKVILAGSINETADTEAAARSAYAMHADRIRAAAAQAGLDPGAVTVAEPKIRDAASQGAADSAKSPTTRTAPAKVSAKGDVEVTVNDPRKLEAVQARIATVLPGASAKPSLLDDRKAHAAAVADGVARARADASLYAASLGFHIVRLKSVSNDGSIDVGNIVKLVQSFSNGGAGPKTVPVFANVRVEYLIAPN